MSERSKLNIPKEYQGKRLWSFSRMNEYVNCPYCYYLDKIKKVKKHDNIFSILGSLAHDINEKYYNENISNDEMIKMFDEGIKKLQTTKFKFSSDPEKNIKMLDKYSSCMKHFYANFNPVPYKVIREKEVYTNINGHIFLGYVDQFHKENGFLIITDDKTSSIYSKEKMEEEKFQLLNYALAIIQQGFPIEKIKIRWNFMKYANVTWIQENGKEKTGRYERWEIIKKIQTSLRIKLRKLNFSEKEIDNKIDTALELNSLEMMPQEIIDCFKIENCYVYINLDQEEINDFKEKVSNIIKEIEEKEDIGEEAFEREKLTEKDSYWCSVLCSCNSHCKYYTQYLKEINLFRNSDNQEVNMYQDFDQEQNQSLDDEINVLLQLIE